MKLSLDEIKKFGGHAIYQKGKALYEDDRVELKDVQIHHFDALVHSSKTYQVRIRETRHGLFALCNCPSWAHCKHSVAAMLAAHDFYKDHEDDLVYKQEHPDWREFFDNITQHMPSLRKPPGEETPRWRIVYLFSFDAEEWSIAPKRAYIKKTGELGRLTNIGQFDSEGSDVFYTPDDLVVIASLNRLNFREHPEPWYNQTRHVDYRPYYYKYGISSGYLFDHLYSRELYMDAGDMIGESISFAPFDAEIHFQYTDKEDRYELVPIVKFNNQEIKLNPRFRILTTDPIWLFFEHQLIRVKNINEVKFLLPFTQDRIAIEIPKNELDEFFQTRWPKLAAEQDFALPDDIEIKTITQIKHQRLVFRENKKALKIYIKFLYHSRAIDYDNPFPRLLFRENGSDKWIKVHRDLNAEEQAAETLVATGLIKSKDNGFEIPANKAANWLYKNLSAFMGNGYNIEGLDKLKSFRIRTGTPKIELDVTTEIDWFDLNLKIVIDGFQIPLRDIRRAVKNQQKYVKLNDGSLAMLPTDWLKKFRHLFYIGQLNDQSLRVSHHHLTLIDILHEQAENVQLDEPFRERIERMKKFQGIESQELPQTMQTVMRPYQKSGYDWLVFLQNYKFGGCLADDMGLGKTLQALAILLRAKMSGNQRTSLIVCPTSVVFNWQEEVQKFAPELNVLAHVGIDRSRPLDHLHDYDIILTTYGIMRRDISFLREKHFYYIILDESHKIKNPSSQTAKASRLLKSDYKLALTGTPIENNTQELWSQFAFLNPGLLGSLPYFKRAFIAPVEKDEDQETLVLLRRLVFPFILRRTKEKVATDLPDKIEQTIQISMTPKQEAIYAKWKDHYRSLVLNKIDEQGMDRARMNVLEGLVKLRQIACHSALIDPGVTEDSGKFIHLKEQIEEILAENHKVLIFSQFVRMLKIIRSHLDKQGIAYEYLDGHTVEREKNVHRFQENPDIKLFLISLKAGGTGLNLTAADYVILFDPWWNPAVETQAMDRAHRIGQERNVFVYRLITRETVEEKMLDLQNRKKQLVSNLITTDKGFLKSLTRKDIELLFS
ncbi:hypothetical protein GF406_21625 [candidate division KSB1 bacterium]|nr:hypothetical protein [candidate division KSB1 bacterium]